VVQGSEEMPGPGQFLCKFSDEYPNLALCPPSVPREDGLPKFHLEYIHKQEADLSSLEKYNHRDEPGLDDSSVTRNRTAGLKQFLTKRLSFLRVVSRFFSTNSIIIVGSTRLYP